MRWEVFRCWGMDCLSWALSTKYSEELVNVDSVNGFWRTNVSRNKHEMHANRIIQTRIWQTQLCLCPAQSFQFYSTFGTRRWQLGARGQGVLFIFKFFLMNSREENGGISPCPRRQVASRRGTDWPTAHPLLSHWLYQMPIRLVMLSKSRHL